MAAIQVLQTPLFARQKKKLTKSQIKELDNAIKKIIENPKIGEEKSGNLSNICVHKFKMVNQLYLLAYEFNKNSRILIALGVHENVYRNVKRYLK
ncbi:MAG: type II toxin-antitoxin system RelE/ParE family toxin [Candidatus Anammoxibacter sp.]